MPFLLMCPECDRLRLPAMTWSRPATTENGSHDLRVRMNQERLTAQLKTSYDFIVCGSGSSGSVVARRLAENPGVNVLLLEAGGDDAHPDVTEAASWPNNIGSERDWNFTTRPNRGLNQRSLLWSMGKALGGGSSINVMVWSRG